MLLTVKNYQLKPNRLFSKLSVTQNCELILLKMADKDGPNYDSSVGSVDKGEKSKSGKGKKKGRNRGNAAPDTTSSPLSESGKSGSGVSILWSINNYIFTFAILLLPPQTSL